MAVAALACQAADPSPNTNTLASGLPCDDSKAPAYTALRTTRPIVVDGRLNDPDWKTAWTPRFVDLVSGGKTLFDTFACVLWDDDYLYVAFQVQEPIVRAKYTKPNSPVYEENDVEFFVAGRDAYYEFEINALNTCYEAFFIWEAAYEKGGFAQSPDFARDRLKTFNGVGFNSHPRGQRFASFDWTFPGRKNAVQVDGTLNKDSDRDRGWTVELAFPWKGMEWLAKADGRALPPRDGDLWRMNFSRFNQYKEAVPAKDSGGWAFAPHHTWDSHVPECFAKIQFSTNVVRSYRPGSDGGPGPANPGTGAVLPNSGPEARP